MIDLSVIIVSYETRTRLADCLTALVRAQQSSSELEIEVLVVDNGSRDGSADVVHAVFPKARLFSMVRNRGFAAGANVGLRAARGRHVLLLNSDVELGSEALVDAVRRLDAESDIGILGIALLDSDGGAQRSIHAFPGLSTEFIPERLLRGRGRLPRRTLERGAADGTPLDVEAVRGAVFFIRGTLLEKLGLLDENYFFFLEETDYCWRAREAGWRVVYVRDLEAVHHIGSSSKRKAASATRIEYHRALYRFLHARRGRGVAGLVRGWRMGRAMGSLVVLGIAGLVFPSERRRSAERLDLCLWHLRGCPDDPGLASALASLPAPDSPGRAA